MQVCTSLQTDNHASTSPLSFLQAGCPSCRPTNSVKALKAQFPEWNNNSNIYCGIMLVIIFSALARRQAENAAVETCTAYSQKVPFCSTQPNLQKMWKIKTLKQLP